MGDRQNPPWAHNPRRQKNMKRRDSDAEDQTGPYSRLEQRSGLQLAESQPGQRERERERERRVSDADASYNGPATTTRTLNSAIPHSKHAKKQLSPLLRPGPSPKAPRQTSGLSTTKTDPNQTLCFSPRTQTSTGTK